MLIPQTLLIIVALFLPIFILAQATTPDSNQKPLKAFKESIKGTLDGSMAVMPKAFKKHTPGQLIFPRSLNSGHASNPWSNQTSQSPFEQQDYSNFPKGNPWAPVGDTQNIPFDQGNITGLEKNPYTDPRQQIPSDQFAPYSGLPFNRFQNQYAPFYGGYNQPNFDPYGGSFSAPFGNSFFPNNQFWPNGNNNGSFPFMPW